MRIAAVGDLHYSKSSQGAFHGLFAEVADEADVLVLCGDLTDFGLPEEARHLAQDLSVVKVPILAVLGNHDYESGRQQEVADVLRDAGVTVLDGESCVVREVGFVGVKGFAGGFGRRTLEPWGEPAIKHFVQESVDEALKLERALSRMHTEKRLAILHYAPIQGTVVGEPPEIWPFLGSSRLADPLDRYRVNAVVHGHVHHGTPEGRTDAGVPVYNCAYPLLARAGGLPIRFVEV